MTKDEYLNTYCNYRPFKDFNELKAGFADILCKKLKVPMERISFKDGIFLIELATGKKVPIKERMGFIEANGKLLNMNDLFEKYTFFDGSVVGMKK